MLREAKKLAEFKVIPGDKQLSNGFKQPVIPVIVLQVLKEIEVTLLPET